MERRTLIRLLVGLGIGLPIAVEAATFLGLFRSRLLGGGGAETPTPTPTPRPGAVGVGDEILPATQQTDTVTDAAIYVGGGTREFRLTVEVENDTDVGYQLVLNAVTTDAGTVVSGGGSTDQIAPGGRATVTGRWELPDEERPATVIAVASERNADGSRDTVTRTVPLARVVEHPK